MEKWSEMTVYLLLHVLEKFVHTKRRKWMPLKYFLFSIDPD